MFSKNIGPLLNSGKHTNKMYYTLFFTVEFCFTVGLEDQHVKKNIVLIQLIQLVIYSLIKNTKIYIFVPISISVKSYCKIIVFYLSHIKCKKVVASQLCP